MENESWQLRGVANGLTRTGIVGHKAPQLVGEAHRGDDKRRKENWDWMMIDRSIPCALPAQKWRVKFRNRSCPRNHTIGCLKRKIST